MVKIQSNLTFTPCHRVCGAFCRQIVQAAPFLVRRWPVGGHLPQIARMEGGREKDMAMARRKHVQTFLFLACDRVPRPNTA